MEIKVKGIVISSKDSGDKDKLVTIFCLNKGIIMAKLKGVSKPNAKLKFAKEPFCFADFILNSKGDFLTITQADCIDTFYQLTQNYEKFTYGMEILKILKNFSFNEENNRLFLQSIKALRVLTYENVQSEVVLIKFLLGVLFLEGYNFSHDVCTNCQTKLGQSRFLDLQTGQVLCSSCKVDYCYRITSGQSSILKIVAQTDYEKLKTLKLNNENLTMVLSILRKNFEKKVK